MSILQTDRTFREPVNKVTTFFMAAFHIGALAGVFFFTWKALAVAIVLWWVAGSLGIGMGYHRPLTHRGFKTYKWVEYLMTVCATLTLEVDPCLCLAIHPDHHQTTPKHRHPHPPPQALSLPPIPSR